MSQSLTEINQTGHPSELGTDHSQPDFLKAVWRKKWLVIAFTVAGAALGYWYHMRRVPLYSASAEILVTLDGQRLTSLANLDTSQTQLVPAAIERVIISSSPVLERAVENNQLEHFEAFRGKELSTAVGIIRSRLSISPMDEKNRSSAQVLRLTYTSTDPTECVAALSAVIEAHKAFLESSQSGAGDRVYAKIKEAIQVLDKQLTPLETEYRKFREDSELMWDAEGVATNPYRSLMTSIYQQNVEMTVSRTKLTAQIRALESALNAENADDSTLLAVLQMSMSTDDLSKSANGLPRMFTGDASLASSTERLRNEEQQRRQLELERELQPMVTSYEAMLNEFGSNHPSVKRLRGEVDAMRDLLKRLLDSEERLSEAATAANLDEFNSLGQDPRQQAEAFLALLNERLKTSQQQQLELQSLYEGTRAKASQLSKDEMEDMELRRQIANTQDLYNNVSSRLQEMNLFDDNAVRRVVNVLTQSDEATMLIPGQGRDIGIGAVLGMMLGSALALLLDLSNQTFYSPEEVADALHLQVLSHVPTIHISRRAKKAAVDGPCNEMLVTYYQPKSQLAESYRGARTHLFHQFRHHDSGVILQVTSPHPADGKSLLASNLAVSIAQAGRRTLIIDADLRRPTQQDMFRRQNDRGFARVLTGESDGEIADTIIPGVVHNLDVMLCGKPPANPAEVLCSGDFSNMLNALREKYDYIIIDSAPVLAVTDPSNIAPLTDGVVVTFRLRRDVRPSALQTLKQLDGVGARLLGVVVNDVGDYYGGSPNGYRYTDSYGYGYVDSTRLNDYFKPDEPEGARSRKRSRKAEQPIVSQPLPTDPPFTQT